MIDGFNSGWIEFEREPMRGRIGIAEVAARLVKNAAGL
jgi:hypothetical protein